MGVYALLINCCQLIYTGIVLVILKSLFWASWFDNGLNKPKIIKPSETIRFRYNIPNIEINDYLKPGVFIDYFLDNDNYENILISFFDKNGMIVNTFTNQNKDSIQKQDYNMELSEFTSNYAAKVTSKKGYNRFRWNLRHKGIKGKDKEENINGPLVKPGKYKVQVYQIKNNIIS